MADNKPPEPIKWGEARALPCVLNTAICFWIGTVHFIVSGGHADFVLVALIIVAVAPWLGHIFKSVGKEGAQYWEDGGQSGSTERPPSDPETPGSPDNTFSGADSSLTTVENGSVFPTRPAFFNLSWEARKVLATLWRYQQIHFPPPKQGSWTFLIMPNTPEYVLFSRGVFELGKYNLVGIADNGQVALTFEGMTYCRANAEVINSWEFTYDFPN